MLRKIGTLSHGRETASYKHGFDVLLLRHYHGLRGSFPTKGNHIDMHTVMTERTGFRVSLNNAVGANFGEHKHTSGRAMADLEPVGAPDSV